MDCKAKTLSFLVQECGSIRCRKMYSIGCQGTNLSDSSGYVMDPEGIDADKLAFDALEK